MTQARSRGRRAVETLLVALFFAFLTLIAARQVLPRLDEVLIGNDNDNLINVWADWWTRTALTDPDRAFWYTTDQYFPDGITLIFHSFSHLNSLAGAALQTFFNPILAYNTVIMANFVLTGLSMFHLARYLTGSAVAGLLAGVVFAFNSHNMYQAAHPVLFSVWCLPWTTLLLLRATRENDIRLATLGGFVYFLGAFASTLLLIIMTAWLGLVLLYLLLNRHEPTPAWRVLLAFGLVGGGLSVLPLLPLLNGLIGGGNTSFIQNVAGNLPIDIVSPLIPHWFEWPLRTIYLGLIPISLMIFSIRQGWRVLPWWLLLIAAYLVAIGPRPVMLGEPIDITLPWSIPVSRLLRHTHRILILLSFALAMLTAWGWRTISEDMPARSAGGVLASVLILGLAFGEYTAAPLPANIPPRSAFYTDFLADAPPDLALAMLPHGRQEAKRYLFYQAFHGRPITSGVVSRGDNPSTALTNQNLLLLAANRYRPTDANTPLPADLSAALGQLADAGVGYVVVHKFLMNRAEIHRWQSSMPFAASYEDDVLFAYRTVPEVGRDYTVQAAIGPLDLIHVHIASAGPRGEGGPPLRVVLGWRTSASLPAPPDYAIIGRDAAGEVIWRARRPLTDGQWSAAPDWLTITEDIVDIDPARLPVTFEVLVYPGDDDNAFRAPYELGYFPAQGAP